MVQNYSDREVCDTETCLLRAGLSLPNSFPGSFTFLKMSVEPIWLNSKTLKPTGHAFHSTDEVSILLK